MNNTIDTALLDGLVLKHGGHDSPDAGLCLMEAVAYVRGIPHTDNPGCVSPVLSQMGRRLNDLLSDERRQSLIPLITELPGTVDDGYDEARSYLALDWLLRTWLPTWLDLAPGCNDVAAQLREVGEIVDVAAAERVFPLVLAARGQAAATWAAARAATWAAARAAARAALRPAVDALQLSAIALFRRMAIVGKESSA